LLFDADPGWNPLVVSLYGMTVLSLLVLLPAVAAVAAAGAGLPARRTPGTRPEAHGLMAIDIRLDHVLLDRRMTLTELADRVRITVANLSILKTGKARAIRLSTLDAICRELDCQPGDLLTHVPDDASGHARPPRR
jgi:putative transcriptional regulator